MKKAVIVAAGKSSRLYPRTLEKPKSLLEIKKSTFLERSISSLNSIGITDILIVVGYKKEMIQEKISDKASYAPNPFYKECNNAGSLWIAKDFIKDEPFVYLHSDIVYSQEILHTSYKTFKEESPQIGLVTDFSPVDEEAMKVLIDDKGELIESSKEIDLKKSQGEWTGIAFINEPQAVFKQIEKDLFNTNLNIYDTFSFTELAKNKNFSIRCYPTNNLPWMEVDTEDDYQAALKLSL